MDSSLATWLPVLVLTACLGIWTYSLVDFSRTDGRDMRTFSKEVWIVILILGSVAGGIAWLVGGRPHPPGVQRRSSRPR
ncbi:MULTISPECIES: PLDc N-terminal domain-containing protein [Arthrobacter]|uniref:PLDc N-terminal domain-containing protein n=1 Tax=Arthrobacter methylotrophus TaxID=121291 RepID=A0ABV5UNB2_9MICC|nr:PLDc N-terminal domain-containing protein [Arthrobacter sp. MA-N2]